MRHLRSDSGRIVRIEPVDGPRRLKEVLRGQVRYYESERAAMREWEKIWTHYTRSPFEEAPATIVTDARETQSGWYLHGVIHPARIMWRRVLEDQGVYIEVGVKGPHWHRLTPKDPEELMSELTRMNRGRTWF